MERSKAAFAFTLFVICDGQVMSNHGLINNAKNKLDGYTLHHLSLLLLASGGSNASIELFTIYSFNFPPPLRRPGPPIDQFAVLTRLDRPIEFREGQTIAQLRTP